MNQLQASEKASAKQKSSKISQVSEFEKTFASANINDVAMNQNLSDVSEQEEVTLIRQLNGYKENLLVKVRIVQLWFMPDNVDPKKLFAIEMIWMDEEGSKIQAKVMNKFTEKYRNVLKSDKTYYIKNLGFVSSRGSFMPTESTT